MFVSKNEAKISKFFAKVCETDKKTKKKPAFFLSPKVSGRVSGRLLPFNAVSFSD